MGTLHVRTLNIPSARIQVSQQEPQVLHPVIYHRFVPSSANTLFTFILPPRYKSDKQPATIGIWTNKNKILKLAEEEDHHSNYPTTLGHEQRRKNTNTACKLNNEQNPNLSCHLIKPYMDGKVKIRIVVLLSAAFTAISFKFLLSLMRCTYTFMNQHLEQLNDIKLCNGDSNHRAANILHPVLCSITPYSCYKYILAVLLCIPLRKTRKSGGLRKNLLHVQRITPLPLPDGGLARRCSMSGTDEMKNNTTYVEKDNEQSVFTACSDNTNNHDKPLTLSYAEHIMPQECDSEIRLTGQIRPTNSNRIAEIGPFPIFVYQYVSAGHSFSNTYQCNCSSCTNTSTHLNYTFDVSRTKRTAALYSINLYTLADNSDTGNTKGNETAQDSNSTSSTSSSKSGAGRNSTVTGRKPIRSGKTYNSSVL